MLLNGKWLFLKCPRAVLFAFLGNISYKLHGADHFYERMLYSHRADIFIVLKLNPTTRLSSTLALFMLLIMPKSCPASGFFYESTANN